MATKTLKVSVVFPVFNEEGNLDLLYRQVKDACAESAVDFEMIFVDNGSTDRSLEVIKTLAFHDGSVRYLSLSRNFSHQNALFAGMEHSQGDAVITMDADLQHPPALIPKMIEAWRKGAEVIYTTKNNYNISFARMLPVKLFYWLISKISGMQLSFGQSDFRLLDRKALNAILGMPEYHKFLRGQVSWIGFKQAGLSYDVGTRHSGRSKFSYRSLFAFALDGIFSFSRYPLHLIMLIGTAISLLSFIYICYITVIWFLRIMHVVYISLPSGWATLAVAMFFLGSIQLIAIGILGEYVGRIYDQTKGRPVFIIREASEAQK